MSVPIFTKKELLEDCVFDLDDFYYIYDRNVLSELFYLKTLYPLMKVTLFTVPNHPDSSYVTMHNFLKLLEPLSDWIQLACHGWHHKTPTEAMAWTVEETKKCLDKWNVWVERYPKLCVKGFKAPGWQISRDAYQGLLEYGYWVADHTTSAYTENGVLNKDRRPPELKYFDVDHPWILHGHTWDVPNPDPLYQNYVRKMFTMHTLPWNQETRFHFISEVI